MIHRPRLCCGDVREFLQSARYQGRSDLLLAKGRKAYSRGQLIRLGDGVVTAEADALFVSPRQPLYEN